MSEPSEVHATAAESPQITMLRLDDLEPDPEQGRKRFDSSALDGLAKSIRECGVLEPLLVAPRVAGAKHRIIAGERRWRAARLASLDDVPCIVRESPRPALDQLVENFQREDLDAIAKAEQIRRTMAQTGLDAKGIAARAGLSLSSVQKYLRLADGPEVLRKAVSCGLRVKVGTEEQVRTLDWTHGLEALRIYNTAFEPFDPTEKKVRAHMRLEALLRRALREDWNRTRWLACATALSRERPRDRRVDAQPEPSVESARIDQCRQDETTVAAAQPANRAPAEAESTPDVLDVLGAALPRASADVVRRAAVQIDAAAARLDAGALFTRREQTLVVYLDRLAASSDGVRRAELLRELDSVMAAVRRLPAGAVTSRSARSGGTTELSRG